MINRHCHRCPLHPGSHHRRRLVLMRIFAICLAMCCNVCMILKRRAVLDGAAPHDGVEGVGAEGVRGGGGEGVEGDAVNHGRGQRGQGGGLRG